MNKINIIDQWILERINSVQSIQEQINGTSQMVPLEEDIPYMDSYIEDLNRQISALEAFKQVLST